MEKIFKNDDTKIQLQKLVNELLLDEIKKSQEEKESHIIESLDNKKSMDDFRQMLIVLSNDLQNVKGDIFDELVANVYPILEKQSKIDKKLDDVKNDMVKQQNVIESIDKKTEQVDGRLNAMSSELVEFSSRMETNENDMKQSLDEFSRDIEGKFISNNEENEALKKEIIKSRVISIVSIIGIVSLLVLNIFQLVF